MLFVPVLLLDEDVVSKRCCILILSLLKRERFGGET